MYAIRSYYEEGKVTDVRLAKTSGFSEVDNAMLDLISKMPDWAPVV